MSYEIDPRLAAERAATKRYPIQPSEKDSSPSRKFLVHVHGAVLSVISKGTVDLIRYRSEDKQTYDFFKGAGTTNLVGDLAPLTVFDAIIDCSGSMRFALLIATPEEYGVFDGFDSLSEKIEGVKDWLTLSEDERKSIITQRHAAVYPLVKPSMMGDSPYLKKLKLYRFTKNTYSPDQQALIDEAINADGKIGRRGSHIQKRVDYLLSISPVSTNRENTSFPALSNALDESVHGQKKAKQKIILTAITSAKKERRGFKCIIVGPTGTGKEALAIALAKGLNQPYSVQSLSGIATAVEVVGEDSSYDHSEPGKLADVFKANGTTEMTLVLKGLDHLGTGTINGDPRHAISSLFDENSSLHDCFLDVPLDCSNTTIISTVESTRNLPAYLMSNATIIHLEPYSIQDKREIATRFMLPQLLKEYGLQPDSIHFTSEALRRVVLETDELGLDGVRQNIDTVVGYMALQMNTGEDGNGVVDESVLELCLAPFQKTDSPVYRFNMNATRYSTQTKEEFLRIWDELQDDQLSAGKRQVLQRKLEVLSSLVPNFDSSTHFDADGLRAALDKTHFGQSELKDRLVNSLNARVRQGANPTAMRFGFGGPAGCGKTSIAQSLAAAMNVPFIKVSLNGMVDPSSLKGNHIDVGCVLSELCKTGGLSAVILLDEVDKCSSLVSKALVDLLDDSCQFTDAFLGFPVSLEGVAFICTFNDYSQVDPFVMDRLTVIDVPGYTFAEKTEIISSFLLPSFEKRYGVKISMDKDVCDFLQKAYCSSIGVRDAKKACSLMIESLLRKYPTREEISITQAEVVETLGAPLSTPLIPAKPVPGCANALGVSGNHGVAFSIQVLLTEDDKLTVTGLAQEAIMESVKDVIDMLRICQNCTIPSGLHIRIGNGGVKKDGPSAGLAIAMAIFSATKHILIPSDVAFTGEVSLFGDVSAVGGVATKVHAAFLAGCKKVFIPHENASDIEAKGLTSYPIDIVPVSSFEEVVHSIFPEFKKSSTIR